MKVKISQIYRIEEGVLCGTEMESVMGFLAVKYPHRKTKDMYIPPLKTAEKEINTFHCCQDNCKSPDFEGTTDALVKHLELHAGRLFNKTKPISKSNSTKTVVRLPDNPWKENDNRGCNPDRRLVVSLYIDSVEIALERQGIGVLRSENALPKSSPLAFNG